MSVIKSHSTNASKELSFVDLSELTKTTTSIELKNGFNRNFYFRFLTDNHGLILRYNSALNNTVEGAWKSSNFGMARYWNDSGSGLRWTIAPLVNPPSGMMNDSDYVPVANYASLLLLPVEGLNQEVFYITLDDNKIFRWRSSDNTFLYLFESVANLATLVQAIALQNGTDIETINDFLNQTVPIGGFTVGTNDLPTLLNAKANQTTTYTKTESDTLLNAKANQTTTYTKTESNTLLNAKANQTTAQQNIDDIQAINDFLNQVDLGGGIVDLPTQLNAKANQTTTYTKTEANTLLDAKLSKSGGTLTGTIDTSGTVSLLNFTNITTSGIYCQNLVSNGGSASISMSIGDTITMLQKPLDCNNKALTNIDTMNGRVFNSTVVHYTGSFTSIGGVNSYGFTIPDTNYTIWSAQWWEKIGANNPKLITQVWCSDTYASCSSGSLSVGDIVSYKLICIRNGE